ncbi:NADH-quinone oxidoreductase subunit NuoH [bacterium]|nr:NADH-quinone oxidoreductase subunit NuoH [bacterium]
MEILLFGIIGVVVLFSVIALNALILVYMERKVSAWMQSRLGPNRVGPFGLFQTTADIVKLILKENIRNDQSDKVIYFLAPILAFVAPFAAFVTVPIANTVGIRDLDMGAVYIFALGSSVIFSIIWAGYGSNSRYALIGAMRSAAQMVSYEVPMITAVLGVFLIAGSLSMREIVTMQADQTWFIVYQPLGFILFLIAGTAEANRAPFDLPEAESELVAGFHTEYTGLKFAFFFLGEYAAMLVSCCLIVLLFLGGWLVPFVDNSIIPAWIHVTVFMIKVYLMIFLMMWFRWTFPRMRVDHLMGFGWKVLLPLAFINLVATGAVVLILK